MAPTIIFEIAVYKYICLTYYISIDNDDTQTVFFHMLNTNSPLTYNGIRTVTDGFNATSSVGFDVAIVKVVSVSEIGNACNRK